jgi:hypothetical protein
LEEEGASWEYLQVHFYFSLDLKKRHLNLENKFFVVFLANLEISKEISEKIIQLNAGVYIGKSLFPAKSSKEEKIYPSVMSIGYNPYFDNLEKTIV